MFGVSVLEYKRTLITILFLFAFGFSFINDNFYEITSENVENTFTPMIVYASKGEESVFHKNIINFSAAMFPVSTYMAWKTEVKGQTEDSETYEMMLAYKTKKQDEIAKDNDENAKTVSVEKLKNLDYLLGHYYTVDSTTYVDESLLDAGEMLAKDVTIDTSGEGPKVLIFHTHSQEAFKDSVKGDSSTTIVGMGAYLTKLLNEKGIKTIHHDGVYDLIDGKMDRSAAYELSEVGVRKILGENPSIQVVIDLHRDGVNEKTHLVTEIDGKQTAKIMFFNGLSRTKANGVISYLPNPYIKDNLAFSLQMQLACEEMYPDFTRRIYLKGYRYSLHMMPRSLLIEAGAQNNTVEEMKNAMEYLSNVLCKVLKKSS